MARKPVIEDRRFNITRSDGLLRYPVQVPIVLNLHGDVIHLRRENEP